MASLRDLAQSLLNSTDLDERIGGFVKNKVVQPIQQGLQQAELTRINYNRQRALGQTPGQQLMQRPLNPTIGRAAIAGTNFLNSPKIQQNPLIQFGSGLISGQNLGMTPAAQLPQTNFGKVAYGAGSLIGSMNPKSITQRVIRPIVGATNPIISKAISPVANKVISGRIAAGIGNVAQGAAINPIYGRKPLEGAAMDFATGVAFGPNQFGKAIGKGFSLNKSTYDELVNAEAMIKNPGQFIGSIQTGAKTEKEALKIIQSQGSEIIDRLAGKYLPTKYLNLPIEKQIKALTDLHYQNKLANVPEMGIVDKRSQSTLHDITSKYGWTVNQLDDGTIQLSNRLGKPVAIVKQNGSKYQILHTDGSKILSGNGQLEKSTEKVMRDYFYAKPNEVKTSNAKEFLQTGKRVAFVGTDGKVIHKVDDLQDSLVTGGGNPFTHDELWAVMEGQKSDSFNNLIKGRGNIRISNDKAGLSVEITGTPTQQQLQSLQELAGNKKVYFDITQPNGQIKSGQGTIKDLLSNVAQAPKADLTIPGKPTVDDFMKTGEIKKGFMGQLDGNQPKNTIQKKPSLTGSKISQKIEQPQIYPSLNKLYTKQNVYNAEPDVKTISKTYQNQLNATEKQINQLTQQVGKATDQSINKKLKTNLDTVVSGFKNATDERLAKSKQLFEQEFGKNLSESDFRKMENEWIGSYKKSEAPLTPKVKNIKDRAAIHLNERKMESAVNAWAKEGNPGVVKPYKKGELGREQPFSILPKIKTTNDKSAFGYNRETAVRNIEDTFGKYAPEIKKFTTDRITENETNASRYGQEIATKLKGIVDKYGIRKKSVEDNLVFKYAEGRITQEELQQTSKNWQNIIKTADEFRGVYDDLLGKINESLTKFGYDPIPKRANYMTHFQEVGSFFDNFGMMFQDKTMRDNLGDKLPTSMSGINMDTKPGKEFFKFALPRTGDKTVESAIGSMERYLEPATRQIYHTDSVQRIKALQDMIVQHQGEQGRDLSNFNSWLSEYSSLLAGKKSVIDRPIEKIFGRNLLRIGNELKKRTGANMVGANVSSALTNFIPLTQSIATTSKPAVMQGMLETLKPGKTMIDGVESGFLTRRFKDLSIGKTWGESAVDKANWLFGVVDRFTSKMIVGGKYYEGLSKGLDSQQAMRQADDYAARVMADRSFGATPTLFNSKVLGALTQFQLEVNNQMSFLFKDIPQNLGYDKKQAASSLGQAFLYGYIFNNLYEHFTGRRPAFDPIGITAQTYEDYTDPDMKKGKATENLVENVSNQLPFSSIVTGGGRLPVNAGVPDFMGLAKGETNLKKEIIKPVAYLLPPVGGGQIKKTVEGINAYSNEGSYTDSGKLRFPIKQTPVSLAKSTVFGQYSSPEAQTYFRKGQSPLSEKQTEMYKTSSDKPGVVKKISDLRSLNKQLDQKKGVVVSSAKASIEDVDKDIIKAKMKLGELPSSYRAGNKFFLTNNDGDIKTIDLSKEIKKPTSVSDPELNKKLTSQYNSKITSRQTEIANLLDAGLIKEAEAVKLYNQVESLRIKTAKAKKLIGLLKFLHVVFTV